MISIHALHYRVRHRIRISFKHHFTTFQSTHSITECDEMDQEKFIAKAKISIHALHYRVRPEVSVTPTINDLSISIHALHYRVRRRTGPGRKSEQAFQSTHSITECDPSKHQRGKKMKHFNPRTPLQSATAKSLTLSLRSYRISIHALHYRVRLCS